MTRIHDQGAGAKLFGMAAVCAVLVMAGLAVVVPDTASRAASTEHSVGGVDPSRGEWFMRDAEGDLKFFLYGNAGDIPFLGDWDCDGVESPGLYRESTGLVYLRNEISQGNADITFLFGNAGDQPLAGDFDGDGCDTVSVYRPSLARVYIINELGKDGKGLGRAVLDYRFGDVGDKPFVGDWDGDGDDTIGLHRERTGMVYLRNVHAKGRADVSFLFGDPGDRFVAGDWNGDGTDTVAAFRPAQSRFFFRYSNEQGPVEAELLFGFPNYVPIAGYVGDLMPSPTTTTSTTAPTTTIPGSTSTTLPGSVVFGSGIFLVGPEVPASTYRNSDSSAFCFWERRDEDGNIVANEASLGIEIVTISATDDVFESRRCATWSNDLSPRTVSPTSPFGAGHYQVGLEVASGVWQSSGGGICEWERLRGFSGEPTDIIVNGSASGSVTVFIGSADVGFNSVGCGTWSLLP